MSSLRDTELRKIRTKIQAELRRKSNQRRKLFQQQEAKRKSIEQKIDQDKQKNSSGFLAKIGGMASAVSCVAGLHQGEWFYDGPDTCQSSRLCTRCGQKSVKTEHKWSSKRRIVTDECEFFQFCRRCGEESLDYRHEWSWHYVNSDSCEQQRRCTRCSTSSPGNRVTHEWGEWRNAGFDHFFIRNCERCDEQEGREAENLQELQVSANSTVTRSQLAIDGLWIIDGAPFPVEISQSGDRFLIKSKGPTGPGYGSLQGQGLIRERDVIIEYDVWDGFNYYDKAEGQLILSHDFRRMSGQLKFKSGSIQHKTFEKQ